MNYTYKTASPEETISLGREIGRRLRGGDVIAYRGGLGAGKTTITRGISEGLGLADEVTSPTFALVNEYRKKDCKLSLIHFDMYRITSGEDLETTGFYDYMDDDAVLAVEWSESIVDELPESCIILTIDRLSEEERQLTLEVCDGDDRFEDISY